jgi:hypothetical protein
MDLVSDDGQVRRKDDDDRRYDAVGNDFHRFRLAGCVFALFLFLPVCVFGFPGIYIRILDSSISCLPTIESIEIGDTRESYQR